MSSSEKKELVITRTFDAPKQLVFDAFTKEEHLKHWWGPAGCSIEVMKLDVKIGGTFHYAMKFPNGHEMYGIFHYKEINAPNKIVFTNSFSDKDGNIINAPIEGPFPKEILNTWTFTELNGKTTLTLIGRPLINNADEVKGFAALNSNMNEGFNKTFDQLEQYMNVKFQIHKQLKTTKMARVTTYLNFPGNTEEAFNFYKSVFKTEFVGKGIQRFGDIPPVEGQPPMSEEVKKLILHVELPTIGGHILMATDAPESMGFKMEHGNNMHINLEPDSRAETKRLYDELSSGGKVTMELMDMFFGAYYGSCTDKYGINWMFTCTETN